MVLLPKGLWEASLLECTPISALGAHVKFDARNLFEASHMKGTAHVEGVHLGGLR